MPTVIASIGFDATSGEGLAVYRGYAYWASGESGQDQVRVIDVSDPYSPQEVGIFATPDNVIDMDVMDSVLYLSVDYSLLQIVSLENPETPEIIGWLDSPGRGRGLAVTDEFVFHAVKGAGLVVGIPECLPIDVNPEGSGEHSTIQAAINAADVGRTIRLQAGVYQGVGNRDLDLHGKDLFIHSSGGYPDSCIIDCEGTESDPHRGFIFHSGESSDAVIEGITIMGGYADQGGAIKCESGSSPTIRNCVFRGNYGTSGGAIYCENSAPTIENCSISYNASPISGAAFLLYSDPTFENCILSHSIEGSAVFGYESNPLLTCTDVVWNEGGDWVGCIADQQNQNGNFSNSPAFCDPADGDFRLQPGSPCLPEHNDCGVLVGALGEGDCSPTGVEELPETARVALDTFPNPFNPHLTIRFSLLNHAKGSIALHDVSGRQVRELITGQFVQGINEVVWDGQDDQGRDVASGVYFVKLLAGKYGESKKVMLLR